jgi:tetratricopeptide (TPR) repeat protein
MRLGGAAFAAIVCMATIWPPAATAAGHAAGEAQEVARSISSADVQRYDIWVAFRPERAWLRANATLTLMAPQPVDWIELTLSPQMRISHVTDGAGRELTFARSQRIGSSHFMVTLPTKTEGQFTIRISYSGTMLNEMLDYVDTTGILLRDESEWYPATITSVFAQHSIHIVVPAGWTAAAGGERTEFDASDRSIFTFTTTEPGFSRAIAASPEHVVMNLAANPSAGVPAIRICAPQTDTEQARQTAVRAADAFAVFTKLIGPAHVAQFTVLPGFSGIHAEAGYSGPGFLVMDADDLTYFGRSGYAPNFLPHEVAHQWFPQRVGHATAEDGWLAESLSEYLAWRYLEATSPADAQRMIVLAMREGLAADGLQPISMGLKLFALGNKLTQQTLYDRGMLVWRTLESVIDRDRVDQALQEYLKLYSGRTASIADFRAICERISGRDLRWFFAYYLSGTEVPEITVERTPSLAPTEVSGEIRIRNVPEDFEARVELRISTAAGLVTHSVAARGSATPFSAVVPAAASHIEIDPDLKILRWTEAARRNREQDTILAEAYHAVHDDDFDAAEEYLRQALAADPENVAGNEQAIRFQLGQALYHMKRYREALDELSRVLALASPDARETDAYYAWAHVYRARIAFAQNDAAGGRTEAAAGLAVDSPVLEIEITPSSKYAGTTTAGKELRWLLQPSIANGGQNR